MTLQDKGRMVVRVIRGMTTPVKHIRLFKILPIFLLVLVLFGVWWLWNRFRKTEKRRGYYEAAGYDAFGCWWITGYHYHLYYHQNILSLGARIFWNGLEYPHQRCGRLHDR